MPTAQRAPAALLVRRGGERLLFDCAEGTQRQLQRSVVGLPDLEEIFLTHFHADHFLGLPGMLKTFALRGRDEPAHGLRAARACAISSRELQPVPRPAAVPRSTLVELEAGRDARARRVPHRGVRGRPRRLRGRLRARRARAARAASTSRPPTRSASRPAASAGSCRRGEPVTLADGRVDHAGRGARPGAAGPEGRAHRRHGAVAAVVQAAHDADLLVHEATFGADERERARETLHSTAARGGRGRARSPSVRLLALTHVSTRYFGPELAARGARGVPRHRRAARLRRDRGAVPGARRAAARQGGRDGPVSSRAGEWRGWSRWRSAGDVAEAEELQEMLQQRRHRRRDRAPRARTTR